MILQANRLQLSNGNKRTFIRLYKLLFVFCLTLSNFGGNIVVDLIIK